MELKEIIEILVAVLVAILASTGFWTFIIHRMDKKDNEDEEIKIMKEMLIGLGHDRITYLGMYYIDRKYITSDEYENLHDYLYKPYEKMGGNGSAKRIMDEVEKLPIYKSKYSQ